MGHGGGSTGTWAGVNGPRRVPRAPVSLVFGVFFASLLAFLGIKTGVLGYLVPEAERKCVF